MTSYVFDGSVGQALGFMIAVTFPRILPKNYRDHEKQSVRVPPGSLT